MPRGIAFFSKSSHGLSLRQPAPASLASGVLKGENHRAYASQKGLMLVIPASEGKVSEEFRKGARDVSDVTELLL